MAVRIFCVLLIACLLSSILGCSLLRTQGSQGDEGAVNGKVVLDFWNGFTGPDGKTMEAMVRQFQKENPDIAIRMQIIPWGTYYDKLTLSLAYGGAPEVFIMHAGRLPEYASFDVLRPLSDLNSSIKPALSEKDFAQAPWEASHYNGQLLAMPLDVHPIGMYYNTKLFREAGVVDANGNPDPPETWEEFLDAAQKITKDTDNDGRIDQWGFVFTWQRTNWFTFAYQHGGGILTPDGQHCALESPENLAALRKMHDLIYKYKVAPVPEGIDAWLAFRQGKVGMALEGIYMLSSLEEQKGLPYAGAPAPQFGPVRSAWAGSHLLCMPKDVPPRKAQAAWRFMRYLSDNSHAWAKGGQVPVRLTIRNSPEFATLPVQAQFAKQITYVQYEPLVPKTNALFPFVDPAIEAVLLNLQTPEEAMADACRRIEQVLSRP